MNIDLTGHHVDLTDALRIYVNDKLSRLERHFDHVTKTHVILEVDKKRHIAEATIHVSGGIGSVHANSEHEDMYAAIDLLVDKLDRQILKHKEKLTDHHRKEKTG
ncbi:MAG: ribosome-associated translation inhibitor RaiA [Gammaproteobacteria bacterium]|nr:ribosome-associated translation inhibitor RaiA [Gammaproteobacteria bacterium]